MFSLLYDIIYFVNIFIQINLSFLGKFGAEFQGVTKISWREQADLCFWEIIRVFKSTSRRNNNLSADFYNPHSSPE